MKCPNCGQNVNKEDERCPHCNFDLKKFRQQYFREENRKNIYFYS